MFRWGGHRPRLRSYINSLVYVYVWSIWLLYKQETKSYLALSTASVMASVSSDGDFLNSTISGSRKTTANGTGHSEHHITRISRNWILQNWLTKDTVILQIIVIPTSFTNHSHHRLPSSLRTDSTDFTTRPFLLSISVFFVFIFFIILFLIGSVRQIKLATRQLLSAHQYTPSYCIVSYAKVIHRCFLANNNRWHGDFQLTCCCMVTNPSSSCAAFPALPSSLLCSFKCFKNHSFSTFLSKIPLLVC